MLADWGFSLPKIEIPIISDIYNMLISFPNVIWTLIAQAVSMLLYGVQMGLFLLIDCVNAIFRSIAGLDVYYVNGVQTEGDIVYSLLQNPVVTSVFTSVLVASIFLLFVTTFIAIFKTEFDMSKSNAKGPIIARAFKSILYFACVPIICILGVYISNVFLRTFDAATSQGAASMSSQVFAAAAYDSNRARNDSSFANRVKQSGILVTINANSTQAEVAQAIDDAFRSNEKARGIDSGDNTSTKPIVIEADWQGHMQGFVWSQAGIFGSYTINVNSFSINNPMLVYYFYDLLGYNYLIGYLASFMVAMLLLTLIIGVIQRIFELVILFVVSPAFVATMPLDEGARFGKWKDAFVKRTLSAYGPVIGINLLFMVLAFVQDIDIFDPNMFAIGGLFNSIVQCLFIIVGLLAVKDFSAMISELVGSNDALSQGESKKDAVKSLGGKVATAGATGVRAGAKTAAWAARRIMNPINNRLAGTDKNKAALANNAEIDEAEQKSLDLIKKKWGISDAEAKKKLQGWKYGTLKGADKDEMDELAEQNQDTFDKAKEDKKFAFKEKAKPKLDLWDEFDKLDDTITGGIRSKMKDSNKKNENPLYALMGEELKKTRYSKRHKQREEEDATKDAKKKRVAELAAATLVDAKMKPDSIDGEVKLNLEENQKIEADVKLAIEKLENKSILTDEEQQTLNSLKDYLVKLESQTSEYKDQAAASKKILDDIAKLKDISAENLGKESYKMKESLEKIDKASKKMDDLRAEIEVALEKAKKSP